MKTLIASVLVMTVGAALALDNTIVNDYWNTTGYVNYTPSERTVTNAADIDASIKAMAAAEPSSAFSTEKCGMMIIMR